METRIPKTLLDSFSNYIAKHLGLDFSQERTKDLQRGLREMAREQHIEDIVRFVCQLIAAPPSASQIEMLSKYFTVCETYFMREQATLNALQTIILPELIRKRRQTDRCLKIWSAGCATGEEPYTIAMILNELLPDIRDWYIIILATDTNPYAIGKARTGLYTKWSFRRTPRWVCNKYFRQAQDEQFEIIPEIKNMVRFARCNLADLDFPRLQNHTQGLDIIFCRNVLMYFTERCRNEILSRFYDALADGGWLIVSAVETFNLHTSRFVSTSVPGAVFYRKSVRESSAKNNHKSPAQAMPAQQKKLDFKNANPVASAPFQKKQATEMGKTNGQKIVPPDQNMARIFSQAQCFFAQGRYSEAIEKLLPALSKQAEKIKNFDNAKAVLLLAQSYANIGALPDAQHWSERAVAIDKVNPVAYYLLATILQEQGQLDAAATAYNKVLFLAPNFIMAYFSLAILNQTLGKRKEAERYANAALSLLKGMADSTTVPDSEGMSAGQLKAVIESMMKSAIAI